MRRMLELLEYRNKIIIISPAKCGINELKVVSCNRFSRRQGSTCSGALMPAVTNPCVDLRPKLGEGRILKVF